MPSRPNPDYAVNTASLFERSRSDTLQQNINVHGMWYQQTPNVSPAAIDTALRRKLVEAYLALSANAMKTASNVSHHFWMDRKSIHALLVPQREIEIPHSMLARSPVLVHLDGEIEQRIAGVREDSSRQKLNEIYNHAANTNIGLRSDVVRLLYGYLYRRSNQGPDDQQSIAPTSNVEHNIHMDIDTLQENGKILDEAIVRGTLRHLEDAVPQEKLEEMRTQVQNARKTMQNCSAELVKAKRSALAMYLDIQLLNLPAKPGPLTQQIFDERIAQPQISYSIRRAIDKTKISSLHLIAPAFKTGFAAASDENSIVRMTPGHEDVLRVINETHESLIFGRNSDLHQFEEKVEKLHALAIGKSDAYLTDVDDHIIQFCRFATKLDYFPVDSQNHLRRAVERVTPLRKLTSTELWNEMDILKNFYHGYMIDYFRLAQEMLTIKSLLQQELDQLAKVVENPSSSEESRIAGSVKGMAIKEVFEESRQLVQMFVNRTSFLPQVEYLTEESSINQKSFQNLVFGILGIKGDGTVRTHGWGYKSRLVFNVAFPPEIQSRVQNALPEAFRTILKYIRPHTTLEVGVRSSVLTKISKARRADAFIGP